MKGSAGIIGLVVALLAGVLVFIFVEFRDTGKSQGVRVGSIPSAQACTEEAPKCLPQVAMRDFSGRTIAPSDLAGKVVAVNVWATWCKPCLSEIPDLIRVQRKYADKDVVLVGLLNEDIDDRALEDFARTYNINYPIVKMDSALYEAFDEPNRLPITFVYDKSGHLRFGKPGVFSERGLSRMLDELLAE